ncbi:hypothetical protein [Polynucleobacter necessarius]|uniref:hypothetical protein n=1 Tax=Polynucleobacter necessarius TaxID=576610 RepID=UPI0039E4D0DA
METKSFRVSSAPNLPHLIEGPDAKNCDWKFINLPEIDPEYIGSICHNRPRIEVRFRYIRPNIKWIDALAKKY